MKVLASLPFNSHQGRRLDVLKMDIEGGEYEVLPVMLASGIRVTQMQIEFHGQDRDTLYNLLVAMLDHGYRLFHSEPNLHCNACYELAFIHNMGVDKYLGIPEINTQMKKKEKKEKN